MYFDATNSAVLEPDSSTPLHLALVPWPITMAEAVPSLFSDTSPPCDHFHVGDRRNDLEPHVGSSLADWLSILNIVNSDAQSNKVMPLLPVPAFRSPGRLVSTP